MEQQERRSRQELLLEFARQHHAQALQYDMLIASVTAFIVGAAAVALGLNPDPTRLIMTGLLLVMLALVNWQLNRVHRAGNRYHMDIARCAWKELERLTGTEGSPGAPMSLRDAVRQERGFEPAGPGVGDAAYRTIQWIPRGLAVVGSALIGWGAVRLILPIPVTGP